MKKSDDPFVQLAIDTINSYINSGEVPTTENLDEELLNRQAGTFVSLKKDGDLRGCIGSIIPTKENIAEEIIANAVSASTRDPRFSPVQPEELEEIDYSVDVLGDLEEIDNVDQLNPKQYGVVVMSPDGRRSGVLLPNLDGVDTIDQQLMIAMQKGGISVGEPIRVYRFEVVRHVE